MSAIATRLALGDSLEDAVARAKEYVWQGILTGKDVHIGNFRNSYELNQP